MKDSSTNLLWSFSLTSGLTGTALSNGLNETGNNCWVSFHLLWKFTVLCISVTIFLWICCPHYWTYETVAEIWREKGGGERKKRGRVNLWYIFWRDAVWWWDSVKRARVCVCVCVWLCVCVCQNSGCNCSCIFCFFEFEWLMAELTHLN